MDETFGKKMATDGVRLRKRGGNRGREQERERVWVYNEESVETKYSEEQD